MTLAGQTALITGASRGIGRAIAGALGARGARLVLVSRSPALRRTARELALETEVVPMRADVREPAAVRRLFRTVQRRFGSLDILVNNAGIAESSAVATTSDELWDETIGTNLTGTFLCTRAALAMMLPAKRGFIVNVISVAATTPFPNSSAYCAAKAGALMFTRVLREEVRASGIRVTAILPGPVDTAIWERLWPEAPRDKMMQPADVAEAVISAVLAPETAMIEEIVLRPMAGNL